MKENPMREIRIEKVTLNIGCGDNKERLKKAEKLLQTIAEQKPIITRTRKRTTFGMPRKKAIGVKVTLRKEKAKNFLKNVFTAIDKEMKEKQINNDNFSIGIKEYIDLPNVKYDPDMGIIGLDVCVTLERPGFSIKRRIIKSRVGKKHLITKEETITWLKKNFGVKIVG